MKLIILRITRMPVSIQIALNTSIMFPRDVVQRGVKYFGFRKLSAPMMKKGREPMMAAEDYAS